MKKRLRLFLSILILTISIALLIWGYAPNPRETRIQPIVSTEMQLPMP
jgi:accessory gene regulator protein AgrB